MNLWRPPESANGNDRSYSRCKGQNNLGYETKAGVPPDPFSISGNRNCRRLKNLGKTQPSGYQKKTGIPPDPNGREFWQDGIAKNRRYDKKYKRNRSHSAKVGNETC